MGKRLTNREKLHFKLDNLSESEVEEVLDYLSIMEAMKREQAQPEAFEDELLTLLSSAMENRRARQVFEWEIIRRRAEVRASARHYAGR
jgi:hypothetical protein